MKALSNSNSTRFHSKLSSQLKKEMSKASVIFWVGLKWKLYSFHNTWVFRTLLWFLSQPQLSSSNILHSILSIHCMNQRVGDLQIVVVFDELWKWWHVTFELISPFRGKEQIMFHNDYYNVKKNRRKEYKISIKVG